MVSNELAELLRGLNRVDKLQVIQLLAADLANDETNLIQSGASYPVWSPYDAVEAANIMLEALNAETSINHAETQGVTPADWIAAQLPSDVDQQRQLAVLLLDLVGSINSQAEPPSPYEKTVFGEAIASKLAKQGIRRP